MPLGKDFIFSANSLQDYLECPRRFELRYILKQSWPAITSQPVREMEHKIQMGNRFHQIAHQYLSGIPSDLINNSINDPNLENWFVKFLEYIKPCLNYHYFSEFSITMPFEEFRLIAVFDFVALIDNRRIMIGDWKTATRTPKREIFTQSIQSFLYPYLAFNTREYIFPKAGTLNQKHLLMEYWFPAFPENKIIMEFSKASHDTSQKLLSSLVHEITQKEPGAFEKTSNDRHCVFCQYRSLCERGIQAGSYEASENDPEIYSGLDHLDFNQIEEIAF